MIKYGHNIEVELKEDLERMDVYEEIYNKNKNN